MYTLSQRQFKLFLISVILTTIITAGIISFLPARYTYVSHGKIFFRADRLTGTTYRIRRNIEKDILFWDKVREQSEVRSQSR